MGTASRASSSMPSPSSKMEGGLLNPAAMAGEDSEFGRAMQQAMALKGQMVKQDRSNWESKPDYLKNTLFHCTKRRVGGSGKDAVYEELDEEARSIQSARNALTFQDKMAVASRIKDAGNELFKIGDFRAAIDKYERACGCFTYFVPLDKDWRTNGIKDETMKMVEYSAKDEKEAEQVRAFTVICINNICACYLKAGDFSNCVKSAGDALAVDPGNVKALYRRATARIKPASAGATELDMAIADLRKARKYCPHDANVNNLLRKLKLEKESQLKKDKSTFSSMFDRGTIVDEDKVEAEKGRSKMRAYEKTVEQIEQLECFGKKCDAQGRHNDANEFYAAAAKARANLERAGKPSKPPRLDFLNPTKEMIQDARKHGLDLNDPMVQSALMQIQKGKGIEPAIDEAMAAGSPSDDEKKANRIGASRYYIMIFVGVAFLYRLWSMGILKRLMGHSEDTHFDGMSDL